MSTEIKVPTLGESVTTATVARWMKKPGEAVAADEPLVELETDKVTVEVNAPGAGTLGQVVAATMKTHMPSSSQLFATNIASRDSSASIAIGRRSSP